MQIQNTSKFIGAALLGLLLTACGGGSSSPLDSYSSSSATSATTSSVDATEANKIGAGSGDNFQEGVIGVGTEGSSLAAGGATTLSVNIVSSTNTLVTGNGSVTFNSTCIANNEAYFIDSSGNKLSSSTVTTTNGQASIIYKANGCTGQDLVTASSTLNSTVKTATVNLTVAADILQSIKFIDAVPERVSLKGTTGDETSLVRFQLLGATGSPMKGVDVTFSLNTNVGGTTLSSTTATSDSNGYVSTTVQAGTIPTSVQVTAKDPSTQISGQSNKLIVSTGLPDQSSMSISTSLFNPSGWNHDGEVSNITIRLADDFNNPVPDGTAVYFTTEGGAIDSSCTTTDGTCSVKWRSQNIRPSDGRVTILATTQGNESFLDTDGDGFYTKGVDIFNSDATGGNCQVNVPVGSEIPADPDKAYCDDLPEAYLDSNENGTYDAGEKFIDLNTDTKHTAADGQFNGIRCKTEGDGCTKDNVTIREDIVLVMSSDTPYSSAGLLPGQPQSISLNPDESKSFTVTLMDIHGNAMPAGTTISLITSTASDVTINHSMPQGGVANTTAPTSFSVTLKAATDKTPSGSFSIVVKAPYLETTYTTSITSETSNAPPPAAIGKGSGSTFVAGQISTGIGSSSLPAGGSTTISVNVVDTNNSLVTTTPVPIQFSSPCITSGQAILTNSSNTQTDTANTASGTATLTYTAFGCVGTDTITASAQGNYNLNDATTTISIASLSVQSIEFVSASPEQISLKGTGGNETSSVKFRVIGAESQPVAGASVTLELNSSLGGLCLTTSTGCTASVDATTDANGYVSATVQAGSIATSVRVTATSNGISTQSSRLVVSTGIPDQNSMSLSASNLNPEAWDYDGKEVTLTIRLADAFNNPPPDGTTVTFTTEGGSIASNCSTTDGACTVIWKSQAPRPSNGRVRILATALGNESFIDTNGNGYYDQEPFVDANNNHIYDVGETYTDLDNNGAFTQDIFNNVYTGGNCTSNTPLSTAVSDDPADHPCDDLGEAYLDKNDNGAHDIGEEFIDYNLDTAHTAANTIYNGVLCAVEGNGCTKTGVTVRDDLLLVMSSDQPDTSGGLLIGQPGNIILAANETTSFVVTLRDIHQNSMPQGTKISISSGNASNATISQNMPSSGVPNTTGETTFTVTVKAGATLPSGSFDIVVQAPNLTTSFTTTLNN